MAGAPSGTAGALPHSHLSTPDLSSASGRWSCAPKASPAVQDDRYFDNRRKRCAFLSWAWKRANCCHIMLYPQLHVRQDRAICKCSQTELLTFGGDRSRTCRELVPTGDPAVLLAHQKSQIGAARSLSGCHCMASLSARGHRGTGQALRS